MTYKDYRITRRSAVGMIMMAPLVANAGSVRKRRDGRPNLLFILPDQHRFDWLSGYPDNPIRTPNLDSLAVRGVRFEKAYCAAPVCAASRACLASGREYDECGVGTNGEDYPIAQTTYYEKLRDAGYWVASSGKLDLSKAGFDEGLDGRNHMVAWGFSDMVNCAGKGDAVFQWGKFKTPYEPYMLYLAGRGMADQYAADIGGRGGGHSFGPSEYRKVYPSPLSDEDYQDNWIGRTGLELMSRFPSDRPWHLVVNFAGPHDPEDITLRMEKTVRDRILPPPDSSTQLTPEIHNAIRQNYTAMVENIDRWVGLYADELRRRGEWENTVIVFSSDHGEMLGDHDRWGKNVPYEGSLCVPLIVAGPDIKHRRSKALISLIDIGATFLDYAKADEPAGMTARSFRPLLEGSTDTHRAHVNSGLLNWRLVTDGRYKLIRGFDPQQTKNHGSVPRGANAPQLLYDLERDPREERNFAESEPAVVARLEKHFLPRNPDPSFGVPNYEHYGRKV